MIRYNPADWYWKKDNGEIFASARGVIIAAADAKFKAWRETGGFATRWPVDDDGQQSMAALQSVLDPHGIVGFVRGANGWAIATPSDRLSPAIKAECGRRVFAVASQNCQMNLTAACAAGVLPDADKTTYAQALLWISQMRAKCAALIAAVDADFAADAKWPACPDAVRALAARF